MKLYCHYTSFEKTELEVREKVSFSNEETTSFLQCLKLSNFAEEFFLISTCNRTEIYYWSKKNKKEEFVDKICEFKDVKKSQNISSIFDSTNKTETSVKRLFKVSNGVLSQVLGDLQIIGQIKAAYQTAMELECTGPRLHKLIQLVFSCYKEVANKTQLHSGSASISYAAMEITQSFLKTKKDKSILIVGAGKFSREVITELLKKGFTNITITNRTPEKARELSSRFNIKTMLFENLDDSWCYDVVISCISSKNFVIQDNVFEINNSGSKLLIDLSVPRSIDPAIGQIKGMKLLNMEHIKDKNNAALSNRKNAIPQVNQIIEKYCLQYEDYLKATKALPVIHQFKNVITEITKQEVNRHSKKIKRSEMELDIIDNITDNIINKIIRKPAKHLYSNQKEFNKLSEALTLLFELQPTQINEHKHLSKIS